MKTIILGDIHGRKIWQSIIHKHTDVIRVIFLGDYFDNIQIPYIEQIENFENIIQFKEHSGIEVILIIGNHDHQYFPDVIDKNIQKFKIESSQSFIKVLSENRHHLQMAFQFGEILCTHAGVGKSFLDRELGSGNWQANNIATELNKLFKINPKGFNFNGFDPTGDDLGQSNIWIRPVSLMLDSASLKGKIIQVVGHTRMPEIPTPEKMGNGRYYFIDTLWSSYQYLLVDEKGGINIKKL
jgi:hypothetical protein